MTESLPVGACIGILGGGQLGRMLSVAASRLGLRCHIYDPAAHPPAGDVAAAVHNGAWDDHAALEAFALGVDVITYEFESIPAATLDLLESLRPVRPGRRALEVSQDRLSEKRFLEGLGLKVAPFRDIPDLETLRGAVAELGLPAILKTRRLGYDGKGQARLDTAQGLDTAFAAMAGQAAILEGFIAFEREVSVIVARGLDGAVVAYDPGENLHEGGILRRSSVPARLSGMGVADAVLAAGRIVTALDYVGVMGVEFFVTRAGLVVNEFAPRVHNSGHWTQAGCAVDQFEQHIRAVAGWPLGDGRRFADVEMENLIGADMARLPDLLRESGASVHLYGKGEVRAGRKMGHVNRVRPPKG
jgi:5-(carboxyamino)imidazole ribonucleotide synthase